MFLVVDLRKETLCPESHLFSVYSSTRERVWRASEDRSKGILFLMKGYLSQTDRYAGEQGLKCSVGNVLWRVYYVPGTVLSQSTFPFSHDLITGYLKLQQHLQRCHNIYWGLATVPARSQSTQMYHHTYRAHNFIPNLLRLQIRRWGSAEAQERPVSSVDGRDSGLFRHSGQVQERPAQGHHGHSRLRGPEYK